jgi:hypothetical protein
VSFHQLLLRLSKILDTAQVAYMLTGSYASSVHGAPRASQDIDIVIAPNRPQLLALLKLLPDTEYYVSEEAALDALARRSQFNVIDFETGWKVDFIIAKNREFSRTEFDRRRLLELEGLQLYFASPEDVLIAKLEWAKLGASSRQIEDAAGIIALQAELLDTNYVIHWINILGLQEQWTAAQQRAG